MIRDCAYETHLGLLTDSHRVVKFTAIVTGQDSVSRIHCYNFMNKISLYLVLFLILLVLFLPLLLILRRHLLTLITLLHIWPWTIPISVRLGDPTWWWLLPSERRSDWSLRLERLRLMRWPERLRLVWWPETILLPQRPRSLWLPNPSSSFLHHRLLERLNKGKPRSSLPKYLTRSSESSAYPQSSRAFPPENSPLP
jgi:hypothetical protein